MSFMNFCLSRKYALLNQDQLDFLLYGQMYILFWQLLQVKKPIILFSHLCLK